MNANLLTGLGIDEVYRRTQGATSSDILPDALGSTVALADTTRALTTQYTYAPYGETTQTGAANNNTQKFTGREDDGTGLMYYRARYYSPTYGRFTAEDPKGFGDGANIYAYVGGSPVRYVDPLGLQGTDPFNGGVTQGRDVTISVPPQPESRETYDTCVITSACVMGAATFAMTRNFVFTAFGFIGGAVVGAYWCPGDPPPRPEDRRK